MQPLSAWLPDPAIRSHHRGAAPVDPAHLWAVAQDVRLSETGTLGRLVRWRIPGTPHDATMGDLFRGYPFTVLEEGERHLVAGLAGRIWTLARDYPKLAGPDEFRRWSERGTVRVAFAHWVDVGDDGRAVLSSEARVAPTDGVGAMRLRALWAVIGRFERLLGAQGVKVAVRRAQEP